MIETSTPVTAGQFFDRRREMKVLNSLVSDARKGVRRWIALLGHRKVGKTSLLHEFIGQHEARNILVYTDCWEARANSRLFLLQYIRSLILSVARAKKVEAEVVPLPISGNGFPASTIQTLARLGIPALDQAVNVHEQIVEGKVTGDEILSAFSLPGTLAQHLKKPLIIILDEFQELERFTKLRIKNRIEDIFGLLRATWQQQKGVSYIVAGSRLHLMRQILTEETRAFFQHFEILNLQPFERKESLKMLAAMLGSERKFENAETLHRVLDLLGDHPFYLRLLVQDVAYVLAGRKANMRSFDQALKEAFESALFTPEGRLSMYMEQRYSTSVRNSSTLESVLRGFVEPARISDVAEELRVRSGQVSSAVQILITEDIVEKREDGKYELSDPAFALWLHHQKDFRKAMPPLLVGTDAEQAVARRLAADGFRSVYQSRASRGSFDLLALHDSRVFGLQVKKTSLPYRLKPAERNRLMEDARRLKFKPVLALVIDQDVRFYDMKRIRPKDGGLSIGKQTTFVESLLAFLRSYSL